jgi:O-antigen ligase
MIFFYLLILTMPLAGHPLWEREFADITVIKYLGGACLLYALLHLGQRRTVPRYFQTGQSWLFLFFVLIAGVSYVLKGLSFNLELSPLISYFAMFLLFFITISVVDTPERLRQTLLAIIASGAWASLYVLREWQKYRNVYVDFRPGSAAGDSNEFSLSVLFCLPIAFCLLRQSRVRWQRWFALGCLALALPADILAASRGGFLGLCLACLYLVWHSRRRTRNLVLISLALIPLLLEMPNSPLRRLLHPQTSVVSDQAHLDAWTAGLRMIEAHPLTGIGLGNFKPLMPFYRDKNSQTDSVAHNTFLEVAAEMGLPTLLIFLGILYWSYRALGKARQRAEREHLPLLESAALGLQAALAGFCVGACFMSAEQVKLLWLTVALAACFPNLVRMAETAKTAEMPSTKRLAFFMTPRTETSVEPTDSWRRIRPQGEGERGRRGRWRPVIHDRNR